MKIGQDFNQIGTIASGELIFKFPGTDLKMPFKQAKAYLSDSGIGYVSLPIRTIYGQENGEPEGISGVLGRQIASQLNDESIKPLLTEMLKETNHSLFYSRTNKGIDVVCLPGLMGEDGIDKDLFPGKIIVTYALKGKIPSLEEVYAKHADAVKGLKLVKDKKTLENEVLGLVTKTNEIYDAGLQILKKSIF